MSQANNHTPMNPLSLVALAPGSTTQSKAKGEGSHWFEAMAGAWGETLDKVAGKIEAMSDDLTAGNDTPSAITALSTETMRMSFMTNAAKTDISSVGTALETMARKG
jgi:hypothetical protein